jgi:hypothetical protein
VNKRVDIVILSSLPPETRELLGDVASDQAGSQTGDNSTDQAHQGGI